MKIPTPTSLRHRVLSLIATTCLLPALNAAADTVTSAWSIAPDERIYVTASNLERGVAYNPVTKNVLLLGRAGGPKVYVLKATDGSDGSGEGGEPSALSQLDAAGESPIAGGTFTLNLVGAGDDGAVYACNLATSIGTVRIYRWADDTTDTPISVAYSGDPLEGIATPGSGQDIRFGDAFAVRGAGKDTQLLQTARNGRYILLYTTTDGVEFKPTVFVSPGDISGKIGLGVTFGEGNTIWAKLNGNALQRIELNTATKQARLLGSVPTSVIAAGVTGISVDPAAKRLAAVDYVAHNLTVYDISDPTGFVQIGDPVAFPTLNANANGTSAASILGADVFAVDTNNGLLAAKIEKSVQVDPPTITTQPAGGTVYEGASFTLAVAVQGTPPFTYRWSFKDAPIPGATGAQLVLDNITTANAGAYSVTVANSAASVPSAPATLTVKTPLNAGILKPLWALNPGDRPYLTTDNTQRGLAFNPATGNLLMASRSPANAIVVLDAANGAEKHKLRTTGADDVPIFIGGTLTLNMIGVAEDGAVFAGNLVTDASAAAFQLYRWDNDSPDTAPTVTTLPAELAIAERWGDTMDVRGKGSTTQILIGARGGTQEGRKFAILSTADGSNFIAQIFSVEELNANAFGLGIAFGPGNSVFGTANGQPLVHVSFNPADGTAALLHTYSAAQVPTAVSFIGAQTSSNLLAGVALENPDNVVLYDISDAASPTLIDQRLILPEQPNVNGTGSVDFGGNKLFALDTNHGLRAFEVVRGGTPAGPATLAEPKIVGGNFSFAITGTNGREYTVQKSPNLTGWADAGTVTAPGTFSEPLGAGPALFRAVAK